MSAYIKESLFITKLARRQCTSPHPLIKIFRIIKDINKKRGLLETV